MKTESLKSTFLIGLTLLICAAVYLNFLVITRYEETIARMTACDDEYCECECHYIVAKPILFKCGESSTSLEK